MTISHDEISRLYPGVMKTSARYDAGAVRETLLRRGGPVNTGFVEFTYRPFDNRWLYWEAETKLLDEKRADYKPHIVADNIWLSAAQHLRKRAEEPQSCFTAHIALLHLIERGANLFPAYLHYNDKEHKMRKRPWNLSIEAANYVRRLGANVEDLFYHVLATLHDPAYLEANAGALKMDWPRIPMRGWPHGKNEGASMYLAESAARGRELALLLDPDAPVPGVTDGDLRPEIAAIAVPSTVDDRNMSGDDFALTAGWGHLGSGEAVMPGQGRIQQRTYTADEIRALGTAKLVLGDSNFDIYLNDNAFWRNVPSAIWNYKLGGYQVLKKWLSYREQKVLGRALKPEEVAYFAEVARRIAGILMLTSGTARRE